MTNEQRLAYDYSRVASEWNGTPFRVDMVKNFPNFVSDDDLREQLEPVGKLAHQIEDQIGYSIVEMGNLIDIPANTAPDWNKNFSYYWQNDHSSSLLPRELRQILVFYMDDDNPEPWDGCGGSPHSAHICCGTISYNRRTMGPWWHGKDPCCNGDASANGRYGQVIVHELFHLLGFRHPDEPAESGLPMKKGSLFQPWTVGELVHSASPEDIQLLARAFPKS